jgi:hypothetical protein
MRAQKPSICRHFPAPSNVKPSKLGQIEIWFSILQGQPLSGASFTSLEQLQEHINAFIHAYNDKAEPFAWRQRRFKGRRITQL